MWNHVRNYVPVKADIPNEVPTQSELRGPRRHRERAGRPRAPDRWAPAAEPGRRAGLGRGLAVSVGTGCSASASAKSIAGSATGAVRPLIACEDGRHSGSSGAILLMLLMLIFCAVDRTEGGRLCFRAAPPSL